MAIRIGSVPGGGTREKIYESALADYRDRHRTSGDGGSTHWGPGSDPLRLDFGVSSMPEVAEMVAVVHLKFGLLLGDVLDYAQRMYDLNRITDSHRLAVMEVLAGVRSRDDIGDSDASFLLDAVVASVRTLLDVGQELGREDLARRIDSPLQLLEAKLAKPQGLVDLMMAAGLLTDPDIVKNRLNFESFKDQLMTKLSEPRLVRVSQEKRRELAKKIRGSLHNQAFSVANRLELIKGQLTEACNAIPSNRSYRLMVLDDKPSDPGILSLYLIDQLFDYLVFGPANFARILMAKMEVWSLQRLGEDELKALLEKEIAFALSRS